LRSRNKGDREQEEEREEEREEEKEEEEEEEGEKMNNVATRETNPRRQGEYTQNQEVKSGLQSEGKHHTQQQQPTYWV